MIIIIKSPGLIEIKVLMKNVRNKFMLKYYKSWAK
jgi:hypothetical protein